MVGHMPMARFALRSKRVKLWYTLESFAISRHEILNSRFGTTAPAELCARISAMSGPACEPWVHVLPDAVLPLNSANAA